MILDTDDTIIAVATPPGKAAISTVRISGKKALEAARTRLRQPLEPLPRVAQLVRLFDQQNKCLDEVLLTFFPHPKSYTGEDVVEISCHGNPIITQDIVNAFLDEGVRLAEAGEFTLRAVLHGKMDLLQAEAVQDLIESETRHQVQQAGAQLGGRLSGALGATRKILIEVASCLETNLEFADDDLSLVSGEGLQKKLESADATLKQLEDSFQQGRIVRDGLRAVLAGKPNVGKSSIFNELVGSEESIVTTEPGTTRDALKENITLGGIRVTLVDTAGIRAVKSETVERLGVARSLKQLRKSSLVLFVVDRSQRFDEEDERIWARIENMPYLLVINKIDLPGIVKVPSRVVSKCVGNVEVSALEKWNFDKLRGEIVAHARSGGENQAEHPTITRLRHKCCIERAREELGRASSVFEAGQGDELTLFHLRRSLDAVGELTGEVTNEEILGQIFSSFCIGK